MVETHLFTLYNVLIEILKFQDLVGSLTDICTKAKYVTKMDLVVDLFNSLRELIGKAYKILPEHHMFFLRAIDAVDHLSNKVEISLSPLTVRN